MLETFISALLLQQGYNATLVTLGAAILGSAAGAIGVFVFLRKRALVSDAIAHATLPGIGLAFLVMIAFGGDGRFLPGLMIGSALSACLGMLCLQYMVQHTRLTEDASIGAVLSVFFGIGVVFLTIIQNIPAGRQAGLETFLLGSTAGMLFDETVLITLCALCCIGLILIFYRAMIVVAFDTEYAATAGISVARTDFLMMGLAVFVTVVGLKIVGLVLIVALLIIPAVTARFWTHQADRMVLIAALIGGASGYIGVCLSSSAVKLPTGPVIVLLSFALFCVSLIFSPLRGGLAWLISHWRHTKRVHLRQGLLALARREAIYDRLTLSVLRKSGYIRADGVVTSEGSLAAAEALQDEARWALSTRIFAENDLPSRYDGLTPIEDVFTKDQIVVLDQELQRNLKGV